MFQIILTPVRRILLYSKNKICSIKSKYFISQQKIGDISWIRDNKDNRLRLDYNLDESSIVFDIGGYKGQWASDIYARYNCKVYIFEPVFEYASNIKNRFIKNRNIFVFHFGLAEQTTESNISKCLDKSSIFLNDNSPKERISLKKISDFLSENSISHIDLMKINIEGGEYGLLEHLIDTGYIQIIDNIQVQFHNNIPNAIFRLEKIQKELSRTHYITYQYPFIWENWRRLEE